MPFDKKWTVLSLGLVFASLIGCQQSEAPGGKSSEASSPAASRDAHPPFGILDSPKQGEAARAGAWAYGWALDDSGVAQIQASTEDGQGIYVKTGQPFPGVREVYPNYPDADKAGFIFAIPKLPSGAHTLTLTIVANDGGRTEIKRRVEVR